LNWERANYFLPSGASQPPYTFGTPGWLPYVLDEQRACRDDVAVFDQTSFAKFVLKGRDALTALQRLCANDIDVSIGRIVYTPMLNARGGFESDLTITRLAPDTFFIVTGSAQATRDFAWIERHLDRNEHASLFDVTSAYSVVSVMGPKAEALLRRLSSHDLSRANLPFFDDGGDRRRLRARARRTHELRRGSGFELYVATDQCVTLYEALWSAGREFGLARCRLLRDRRVAHRSRPPRVWAPSCRPMSRLGKRVSHTQSSSRRRCRSSAARLWLRSAMQASENAWFNSRSTIPLHFPGGANRC
jgi:4-methylaminobutanoate oxidase (formaldehyde-forming)